MEEDSPFALTNRLSRGTLIKVGMHKQSHFVQGAYVIRLAKATRRAVRQGLAISQGMKEDR
jgi:hypothetical protein